MEKHSSEPFNPNIAHVYYLAGFIESWGRGIEKICESCREDGVPLPEYDITGNSVMIKFIAPEDRIVHGPSENKNANGTVRNGVNVADSVADGVVDNVVDVATRKLTTTEQAILEHLSVSPRACRPTSQSPKNDST